MRRDKNDKKWFQVKKEITKRDGNNCRLVRILSVKDMYLLKKNVGIQLNILDPAHIFPVSLDTSIMYEPANLVQLNRYSHSMLDNMKDPITGKSITRNKVYDWWQKIAGEKQWFEIQKLRKENKHERK